MQSIARLAAIAVSLGLGCQSSKPTEPANPPADPTPKPALAPAPVPAPAKPGAAAPTKDYAGDIAKLCDVVQLSNAQDESDRRLTIANWLAANLTTTESRQFLAEIQPLMGDEKANALDAEAKRVGLASCALAAEWRPPT